MNSKKQYMTSANILSENGVKNLANKLSGYISYLNREKDPTQFAQPIMINVPVLMNHIDDDKIRQFVYLKKQLEKVDQSVLEQIKILKEKIKELKKELKEKKAKAKDYKKSKAISEEELDAIDEEVEKLKELINKLADELKEANENKGFTGDTTKLMKEKLTAIKNSLIQEYILFTKCKNFKYVESGPHKVTKKMLTLVSNKSLSNSNSRDSSYASSNKTSLSETYNPKTTTKKKPKPKAKKQKKAQTKNNTYKSFSN